MVFALLQLTWTCLSVQHPHCTCDPTGELHAAHNCAEQIEQWDAERPLSVAQLRSLSECARRSGLSRIMERRIAAHPDAASLGVRLIQIDLYLQIGRPLLALERIRDARRTSGDDPRLALCGARAYAQLQQRLGAAKQTRDTSIAAGCIQGDYVTVCVNAEERSTVWASRESAFYQLRRALDGGCDSLSAQILQARLYSEIGRPVEAVSIIKHQHKAIAQHGTCAELWQSGDIAAQGLDLQLLRHLRRAYAERHPEQQNALLALMHGELAAQYELQGAIQFSIAFLRRAEEIAPNNATLLERLADQLWDTDQISEARRLYQRVLQLERDHPRYETLLERIGP